MDVSSIVDYELLYALHLRHPVTDEPLDIVFNIRSAGSEAAKEIFRKHTNKNLERRIKGKMPKSEQVEAEELEKAASWIASWDWGSNTYEGKVPELSMKVAVAMLEKEGWMFGQVSEAANKIENFTPPSAKPSADG